MDTPSSSSHHSASDSSRASAMRQTTPFLQPVASASKRTISTLGQKAPAAAPAVHNLILYKKPLHPELFQMKARKNIVHGPSELEAWLMNGSHMVRFQHKALCLSELVTDVDGGLPLTGAVASFQCLNEKDFEQSFREHGVNYITTVQTENLSDSLYRATYQEMLAFAQETDSLKVAYDSAVGNGKNLSVLHLVRLAREIHAEAYHLFAQGGLVLRTQTIFEFR